VGDDRGAAVPQVQDTEEVAGVVSLDALAKLQVAAAALGGRLTVFASVAGDASSHHLLVTSLLPLLLLVATLLSATAAAATAATAAGASAIVIVVHQLSFGRLGFSLFYIFAFLDVIDHALLRQRTPPVGRLAVVVAADVPLADSPPASAFHRLAVIAPVPHGLHLALRLSVARLLPLFAVSGTPPLRTPLCRCT
jgi:hypothetical protein